MGKVRLSENDTKNVDLTALQKMQNQVLRLLNNVSLKDKIRSSVLAQKIGYLSVNQINAQIKLTEFWKITNVDNYPLMPKEAPISISQRSCRSKSNGKLHEINGSEELKSTFINDGTKLWNLAPEAIKGCKSLQKAKLEIKKFSKTLPF